MLCYDIMPVWYVTITIAITIAITITIASIITITITMDRPRHGQHLQDAQVDAEDPDGGRPHVDLTLYYTIV